MDWLFPLKNYKYKLPKGNHPGAFGRIRAHHVHEGVDLYASHGDEVFAVDAGVVVNVINFTGKKAKSPWWKDTQAVLVKGDSGVVCYGEIESSVAVGDSLERGALIGTVSTVLKKNKGNPTSMLHLELYKHDIIEPLEAKSSEDLINFIDPTPLLEKALYLKEKVILGICGSISAYKGVDLARSMVLAGMDVRVILTKGALEFLKPEVFSYLGIKHYLPTDDFKAQGEKEFSNVLHIDLAKWADKIVIAPASANTLAKISYGMCDDLLSSVWLSMDKEKSRIIAPAMNTVMLSQEVVCENIKRLVDKYGVEVIEPSFGLLACGDIGSGKLPNVKVLTTLIETLNNKRSDKKICITAGATIAPMDSIRYISNPAKGATGFLLAKKYLKEGHPVQVIVGKYSLKDFDDLRFHPRCEVVVVGTTDDLLAQVQKSDFDIYISTMAVSDLKPVPFKGKLKKKDFGNFQFDVAPDVLKWVVDNKKDSQIIVGFAAESSLTQEVLTEKLARKPVDLLVANVADGGLLGGEAKGFGSNKVEYKFISKNRSEDYILSKQESSHQIYSHILEIINK